MSVPHRRTGTVLTGALGPMAVAAEFDEFDEFDARIEGLGTVGASFARSAAEGAGA